MAPRVAMNLPDHYRSNDLAVLQSRTMLAASPAAEAPPDRLDLRFLSSIFRRRLRLFAAIVGVIVLVAFLYTLAQPKLYRATADVVMIKDRGEIVPDQGEASSDAPMRSEEIDTELKIIKSQETAGQVIAALGLDRDKALIKSVTTGAGPLAALKRLLGRIPPLLSGPDLNRRLADALLQDVKAERMETAYAIRISYTNSNPQRAAAIANAFARSYAASAVNAKRVENEKTLALLRTRIEELRKQAQVDFKAVQDFRVSNNLLSSQATQLAEQEAAAYGQQLAAARAAAAIEQGRAGAVDGATAAAAVNSPVIQSLRSQRAALSIKVADLSGRYLDGHPDLIGARRELADIDSQIDAEIRRVRSGTSAGIFAGAQASAHQAGSLQGNLSAARGALAANNKALVGLDDLSRKAQASQSMYESYLGRYKEVLAQAGIERPTARLLSEAKVPGNPISPSLILNLALALVIGTLLGAGAAIATETAFSGLTTGEDVESRLGVRYLGGVPLLSSIDIKAPHPGAAVTSHPGSGYTEAIRGLLSSVRNSGVGRNQVIAVTSALPSEGKTSLAVSLARAAAMAGERVIMIDCDLVRHSLSDLLGVDKARAGLREIMRDGARFGDVMVKDSQTEAMILPITSSFAKDERLLEQGNFNRMIAMLREHFAVVVLDTSPILPIAQTREIVSLADNVIVTALWRKTADSSIRAALRLLPHNMISDLGVTLNRIDMKKQVKFGAGDASSYYDKYKKYYVEG